MEYDDIALIEIKRLQKQSDLLTLGLLQEKNKVAVLEKKVVGLKVYEAFYDHIRKCVSERYTDCNHVVCAICYETFEQITLVSEQALEDERNGLCQNK